MTSYGTHEAFDDIPDVTFVCNNRTPNSLRATCIEESEPLNENGRANIKMQESPYADNRWGSEDDMLEYEDGPLCTCGPCKRRRALTGPEKGLIVLALVAFVVIIVLAAHMGWKDEVK
ncbi:hypothetical protein MAR_015906, partial [Mya arenaria]